MKATYASHIIRDLEVIDKEGSKLRIEVKYIQQVISVHSVEVAVGECPHSTIATPHRGINAWVLAENVVLAY